MNVRFYIIKFKDFLKLIDVNNYNIKINTFDDQSKEIEKSSCIFGLKNLEKISNSLKINKQDFINKFIKFEEILKDELKKRRTCIFIFQKCL